MFLHHLVLQVVLLEEEVVDKSLVTHLGHLATKCSRSAKSLKPPSAGRFFKGRYGTPWCQPVAAPSGLERNDAPAPLAGPPSPVLGWVKLARVVLLRVCPTLRCKPCCVLHSAHLKLLLLDYNPLHAISACSSQLVPYSACCFQLRAWATYSSALGRRWGSVLPVAGRGVTLAYFTRPTCCGSQ
jgi:hypothetical protein